MSRDFQVRLALPRADFRLDVDLRLPGSGITVLFGRSGSGKTSVLRGVAGLEASGRARIVVGGETWQDDDAGVFLPTHRRALGYVFQEASLFDHLDVQGNLDYGRKRSRAPGAAAALGEAVELLGIGHLLRRRVGQLSGGERQRVAIARALAATPRLLLLDEPLASLDAARRHEILPWLEKMHAELKIPMLYVTHSVDELARLADYLVVLEGGRVKADGPVEDVLSAIDVPVLEGEEAGALVHGVVAERSAQWQLARIDVDRGSFWLRDGGIPLGQQVRLRIMARDVSLATREPRDTSIQNHFPCVVESIAPDSHPSQVLVRVRCGQTALLARVTRRALFELGLAAGSPAWVQVKSAALLA
ncbi:molybdenum ABC transporter ATP-binding protein [Massilia sp. IC2-477]|uniref:molybdenum ABC transporter ATP-binding protein n=1 Tax=Massilia sp. IC2-477 TaxID=2887198 RepID=UPI001D129C68|nr:molybdenum ABC transporter ATP-binding protein [Massilia sp. IC2-477]